MLRNVYEDFEVFSIEVLQLLQNPLAPILKIFNEFFIENDFFDKRVQNLPLVLKRMRAQRQEKAEMSILTV